MAHDPQGPKNHDHCGGCGCHSPLLTNMIESAGRQLTRRDFVKTVAVAGTALAVAGPSAKALAGTKPAPTPSGADTIYSGGPILTMTSDQARVEALAVKDGKILAAGALASVMAAKGPQTKLVDLAGRCMMPGFIDPHSHVVLQSIKFSVANLDPKPIGTAGSIADIQAILRDWIKKKKPKPGAWVFGWGYDDTGIKEQRHPTRQDLDAVSTEHPILLVHISCHLATGNSKMLEVIGVNADTPDPEGGRIERMPGGKEPNGVFEEQALMLIMQKMPTPSPQQAMDIIAKGLEFYAQAGITTAQDCASGKGTVALLKAMEKAGRLPMDIIAWPVYKGLDEALFTEIAGDRQATGRLRLGGVKMTVDGSIQGYTAFLSQPYFVQPGQSKPTHDKCDHGQAGAMFISKDNLTPGAGLAQKEAGGHRGYSNMTQAEVDHWVKRCDAAGVQMQIHTNGDAATDMLMKAVQKNRGDHPRPDLRTAIIHAQTMREDQLDLAAQHGLTPSFFPIHVYFWGDRHREIFLGPERAARIDPAKSALDRGLKFTLHHDAPVAGIEMLTVVWSAVNRVTSGGQPLGPEQKITPFQALRAITADAAWQNFEEGRKGTLEPGKLADMVVLSADPLAVDPIKIRDIKVMGTIKDGEFIFQAQG